jgi:uncharacterized protein (TIGR03067 family)
MRRLIAVGMVVALAVSAPDLGADDDKKGDAVKKAAPLEGTWVATSWKRGDGEVGKDKVATELKLTKTTYEFPTGINRISKKGAIQLDAAKGTIDFTPEDGPAAGKTLLGLYKVEGDTLTLCFTTAGRDRPKELKSTDRLTVLAKYERKVK